MKTAINIQMIEVITRLLKDWLTSGFLKILETSHSSKQPPIQYANISIQNAIKGNCQSQ